MILVSKPKAPARLRAGLTRTQQDCTIFGAHRSAFLNGTRTFTFYRGIYGHKAVKTALLKAQHQKCCFCEGRFSAYAYGDVEHYRPKGSVRQAIGENALHPGYFWLAYSWDNLFFSCQTCNRTYKRDLFPLVDPAKRARSHNDDLSAEAPLMINPGGPEDPRRHIRFRQNLALGATKLGQITIDVAGLNRPALIEDRLNRLQQIQRLLDITQLLDGNPEPKATELVTTARREIQAAVEPAALFSAMASDYLSPVSGEKRL